jgi:hypothetical protein
MLASDRQNRARSGADPARRGLPVPAGEPVARFEGAREAPVAGTPRRGARAWLTRDYAGFGEGTAPHRLVLAATASVPLVLKLVDSPHRPPAFASARTARTR